MVQLSRVCSHLVQTAAGSIRYNMAFRGAEEKVTHVHVLYAYTIHTVFPRNLATPQTATTAFEIMLHISVNGFQ